MPFQAVALKDLSSIPPVSVIWQTLILAAGASAALVPQAAIPIHCLIIRPVDVVEANPSLRKVVSIIRIPVADFTFSQRLYG